MRNIKCGECGNVNEVADAGDLPRCEFCDQSLRTGSPVSAPADGKETGAPDPDPAQTEAADEPGLPHPAPPEPCSCDDGGSPMTDDPETCFLCGGVLPGPSPADESPAAPEQEPEAISCSLILADGRSIPVAGGLLVTRGDPGGAFPHIVNVSTATVSRKHAWLRVTGREVEIVDLCSTNGTWIEGRRIHPLQPEKVAPAGSMRISFGHSLQATLAFD